mmetsp:Transcript_8787/g.18753  ORF Transcript_8787/g.18753 Transcript_8787/m.18753 type:complete len:1296 (-) Transcript_8787:277-4164(-)
MTTQQPTHPHYPHPPTIGQLERQVIEAALITTRPTSSSHERSEASSSLERWTNSSSSDGNSSGRGGCDAIGGASADTSCWEAYLNILRASLPSSSAHDAGSSANGTASSSPAASRQSSGWSDADDGVGGNGGRHGGDAVEEIAFRTSRPQQPLASATTTTTTTTTPPHIRREADGAKLLLVTLLSNKIRREYLRLVSAPEHAFLARRVYEELVSALLILGGFDADNGNGNASNGGDVKSLLGACCSAAVAVAVRSPGVMAMQQIPPHPQLRMQQTILRGAPSNQGIIELVQSCKASIAAHLGVPLPPQRPTPTVIANSFAPNVALRLLGHIPEEVQSRTDWTCADMDAVLQIPSADHRAGAGGSAANAALETIHLALTGYASIGVTDGASASPSLESRDEWLCESLKTLSKWTEGCKAITLSQLHETLSATPTTSPPNDINNRVPPSLLTQLLSLLSAQSHQKQWSTALHAQNSLIHSSRALAAAISNTGDYGTSSRRAAASLLLSSLPPPVEFLRHPLSLSQSQHWEDAIVALSDLAATLAREEMDDVATCRMVGSTDLVELLLSLQSHPVHAVAVPVLEAWLTLQDVPTSERHPDLASPLYGRLVEVILKRVAYPPSFVSWEEELDVDEADFEEMRRLATDVLVGAYFLMRAGYLEKLAEVIMSVEGNGGAGVGTSNRGGTPYNNNATATATNNHQWEMVEASLYCLTAVSREACARVKSVSNAVRGGRDSPVSGDGTATASGLTQLAGMICAGGAQSASGRHPLVLSGVASFLGGYSAIWALSCPPPSILQILSYLSLAIAVPAAMEAAGKSVRSVAIASASTLSSAANSTPELYDGISATLAQAMDAALATGNAKAMNNVAEGCARLAVQLRDSTRVRAILSAMAMPTLQRARSALDAMVSSSGMDNSGVAASQMEAASQVLSSCLGVLREIIRFCDEPPKGSGDVHILSDVLTAAWPLLNDISSRQCCRANDAVLSSLLEVQSQLLGVVPALIAPYFKELISFVVRAYEETFCPSALDYISAAVELFDSEQSAMTVASGLDESGKDATFSQLLSHLCQYTFTYITQTKRPNECPQIIKAMFEMAQRYLLFCPGGLCQCPEFSSLFALATACLTECKGETESTRATAIFLTQLIGWKQIRLPPAKLSKMEQYAGTIDNLLAQHGEAIVKACIGGLSGGMPQILWPSLSECLFVFTLHIISTSHGADEPNSILYNWFYSAISAGVSSGDSDVTQIVNNSITPELKSNVISIVFGLAKEGVKSKPKAKMLLMDFGKICKGETSTDALLAYSLG